TPLAAKESCDWAGPKSLDHWLTEEWERRAGNGQAIGLRLPPPPEPHLKMPPTQSHQAAASSVRFLDTPAAWQTVYATGTCTQGHNTGCHT
ncbi:unnamed protein product, partial [Effrenium voratum]